MKYLAQLRQRFSQLENLAVDMTALAHAEEALEERDMELRAIVDSVHTGLMRLDQDMVVRWVNEPMAAMFGFWPDEMLGRLWFDLVPCMEEHRPIYEKVLLGETLDVPSAEVSSPEGQRYFELHYCPLLGRHGTVSNIFVIAADITARRRAEEALREAEARYRQLAVRREQEVIALEQQINELLEEAGEPPAYDVPRVARAGSTDDLSSPLRLARREVRS